MALKKVSPHFNRTLPLGQTYSSIRKEVFTLKKQGKSAWS
ncbi:hypothetical protein BOVAC16_2840 [Bacteroides ovatus]|nr:hypothetical protein BOVAC16_2840 [Bacteroides ovatus]